ncbi:sentrin-specific protease 8-like isoform X1 [Lytechinus pictus]|uniref:sentrin-specific protease 8-like isoform X1 n=1 Tax=Lytechinus pictus TaxID=7653 RepID=UPI0030BA2853
MASTGPIVLSYHNCLLRRSDLALLEKPRWLNDQVISFAFEYYEYDLFKDFSDDVAFIGPDIAQFIKLSQGAEVGMFLESLNLAYKQLVFLAINDSESDTSVGGSHWSLLVCCRRDSTFRHYDSASSYNEHAARQIAEKMQPHVGLEKSHVMFVQEQCTQQENGYDCGLFVICNAEHICKDHFQGTAGAVTQAGVTKKRDDLKNLILQLAAAQDGVK